MKPEFTLAQDSAAELAGFQALLARCPTAADRKGLIISAYGFAAIFADECSLLIEAHGLETA